MFPLPQADAIERAVAWLVAGGIVAFPTDTMYGLAADPRSARAIQGLFDLKGRDARAALPLIGGSRSQIEACCGPLTGRSARLADALWPGPLSLVTATPEGIVPAVDGGSGTVAVRVPAHPLARALAGAFGYLVTATSANRSGEPAAVTPAGLAALAADARVVVLDGGASAGGAPSTIVDARSEPPRLLREGAVPWSRVLELLHE